MPEGPEVKKIAEALATGISGKTLINIEILSGRYTKKSPSDWDVLKSNLPLRVIGAGAHGKFCYWLCNNEVFIYSTFGMTGFWSEDKQTHSRLGFKFSDNSIVYFNDQRNFGTIKIVTGKQNLINKLKNLGPDMLTEDISDQTFILKLRAKQKWGITKALMDQSVIAGVGNYIKSESLWLAKIDPRRSVANISDGELAILNRSIKLIVRESYNSGRPIKSYPGFEEKAFDPSRNFLVYNQKLDPNGKKVLKEETDDKRMTYWVPEIQK